MLKHFGNVLMFQRILTFQNLEHCGNVLHAFMQVLLFSICPLQCSCRILASLWNRINKWSHQDLSEVGGGALSLIQQQSPKVLGLLGGRQHEIWGVCNDWE